jgi:heme-degrading monooxygenase HmoA
MIARIWHGWTTPERADQYENLLRTEVFIGIEEKKINGYRGIQLLRRSHPDEVEFITLMSFDSWEAVKAFAGEDYETAHVPPKARAILKRYDQQSQHYEVIHQLNG